MNTVIEFGTFYLLFWWVMCVLYKDNWLQTKLNNVGIWLLIKPAHLGYWVKLGKLIQKLGLCNFCMESHTATILAIGYSCYWLDPNYLYWGFLCASINGWLRTFIKE